MKGLVEGSMVKLTLPTSLDAEHQQMLNELNAKSGKDFDQIYDQIQVKPTVKRSHFSRLTQKAVKIPS
jgi:predicted outer membrane protein